MRFFVGAVLAGAFGCCLGPGADPEPTTRGPSPLEQMVAAETAPTPGNAPPSANPPPASLAVPPPAAPSSPTSASPSSPTPSPACAQARADRDALRDRLADLRMTVGGESGRRVEQTGQAMGACNQDPACLRDTKARTARIAAYDAAKAAYDADVRRLSEAEAGLYGADQAVAAVCGEP